MMALPKGADAMAEGRVERRLHMGRLDEARQIVNRLRAITSDPMPDLMPLRKPEDRELWLSGLRLATGEAK
jgi:hypothetical protein